MGDDSQEPPEALRERPRGFSGEMVFHLLQTGEVLQMNLEPAWTQAVSVRQAAAQAPARTAEHWLRLERLGS
jgi:hypothetical protein